MVYFHRIGRTARAGAKGRAITLVSYSSVAEWEAIKKQTKVKMTDLNEKLGIKISIPDPLKRRSMPRQNFRQFRKPMKQFTRRRQPSRDQYEKRTNKTEYVKRHNFNQKRRW
jgi:ATP-dependent RNA helicase DeaD